MDVAELIKILKEEENQGLFVYLEDYYRGLMNAVECEAAVLEGKRLVIIKTGEPRQRVEQFITKLQEIEDQDLRVYLPCGVLQYVPVYLVEKEEIGGETIIVLKN